MARNSGETRQAIIDSILEQPLAKELGSIKLRLLATAKLGMDAPHRLNSDDIRDVCYALVVFFHKDGID